MSGMPSFADRADHLLSQRWVEIIARLAVVAPFLISGVAKAIDFAGAVGEVRMLVGVEPAWLVAAAVVAVQLGGSLLVMIGGRRAVLGSIALIGFTILATLAAHAFWLKPEAERMMNQNIFFEHVAIVGGLLLVALISARASAR